MHFLCSGDNFDTMYCSLYTVVLSELFRRSNRRPNIYITGLGLLQNATLFADVRIKLSYFSLYLLKLFAIIITIIMFIILFIVMIIISLIISISISIRIRSLTIIVSRYRHYHRSCTLNY